MPSPPTGDLSETFGRHSVDQTERRHRIRQVFRQVAPRYDLMNDLMSLGIHRLWKRSLARELETRPGQTVLDLAGGTGDVARLIAADTHTTLVCDPSLEMMSVGRGHGEAPIGWLAAEAEALPFADASVAAVTISFGIRNVTRMDVALREILRILAPGGCFLCLEFSRPWAPIRPFYNLFSATVIPRLGAWVAGEPAAYTYLIESIQRFPDQEEMKALLQEIGFSRVSYRNLSLGIACVHRAIKGHGDGS